MRNFGLGLAALAAIAMIGCGDDGGGRGDDGGIVLMDSGSEDSGGGTDSGTTDSGTDSGGSSDLDSCISMIPDPIPALPSDPGPYCTDQDDGTATTECIAGCSDLNCVFSCAEGDVTDPPAMVSGTAVSCADCWNNQFSACLSANGCHDQLAAFNCCIQVRCPSQSESCINSMCADEVSAFQSCVSGSGSACVSGDPTGGEFYSVCF